jgi:hypothetical protein
LNQSIPIPGQISPESIESLNSGPAQLGTSISRKDLDRIAEKVVRGVTWVLSKRVVDQNYTIRVSSSPRPNPEFDDMTVQNATRYDRGPGLVVYRAKATDEPIAAYFLMKLFGRIDLRATLLLS